MRPVGDSDLLDVRIVRKAFRSASGESADVLRDVAFTLAHGEVGAFVGPSGCGKTTMLRIIAGLDADFEGAVTRPSGTIGMVFQEPRLLKWRRILDNVLLPAEILGLPLGESRARARDPRRCRRSGA